MTTTTMEGNRIIAEFMGATKGHDDIGELWYLPDDKPILIHEEGDAPYWFNPIREPFKYHTSWDWLMPVVEKIYKLSKDWPKLTEPVWQIRIVAPIETVYQNVVDVIIAYNTSNRPDGE